VVPDEVSEGRGLGEEGLGGWRTKEREESGGTSQIPMDDGAVVLRRAMGTSARGSGAFETGLSGTGQRGKKGGSAWARPCGGGRQCGVAGSGPRLSGTGSVVAIRIREGGGRWVECG
jgi:hypothetical protein